MHNLQQPDKLPPLKSPLNSLVLILALLAPAARAQFAPIILNPASYNQDMIVERPAPATTASMDNGPANNGGGWYEQGYNANSPATGLPTAGSTFVSQSAGDHLYTMAPDYTTNNAVLIDPTVTNGTITLTFPAAYSSLSFLASSGNGPETIAYTVHHQDSTVDTGTFVVPDWFFVTPYAVTANGRVDVQARTFDNVSAAEPRLYSVDINLGNTASPVTSIGLARTGSGGHGAIFAVSGSSGSGFFPIDITGYNKDMIIEAGAQRLPPGGLYTTASMDGGIANTGYGWYVTGFDLAATATGLPAAGATIASAAALDHQYKFAPSYSNNDVVLIDSAHSGSLMWATNSKHSALSFLASAGHGPIIVDYTVNHADATTETGTITVKDWFNSTPAAFTAKGRVDVSTGVYDAVNSTNPRLYTSDITLANTVSPVVSVDLSWDAANTNTGLATFFAVSGTGGSIAPVVVTQPVSLNTNLNSTVQFTAAVSGSAPLTLRWQKGANGVYTNLTDGGRISGSTTTNLTISSVTFSDDADFRLVVTNVAGNTASTLANLNVISSTPDVTVPGDSISLYNGSTPVAETVGQAIDNTTSKYLNYGANASFPPFVGPVGLVVTPAKGSTVLTGLRMYTGNDSPERDPADYLIEGSNDGGGTFTLIANGSVALPDDRNAAGQTINPITQFNREIHFVNNAAYTTYRLSIANVKNNITANSMQVGEIELLGVTGSVSVTLLTQPLAGGQLQLTWSQGTLQSAARVAGPYSDLPSAVSPYTVSMSQAAAFYRVRVQ